MNRHFSLAGTFRILSLFLASGLVALAAWLVHVPSPAQADDVPEKYRDTVKKGLAYLAKHQHKDGHWEGDGGKYPVAMTGLVGLAFHMEGSTTHSGNYSVNVRNAVDWLVDQSKTRTGLIFSGHPSETDRYMLGHGLAMVFLGAVYYEEVPESSRTKRVHDVLVHGVDYTCKSQSTQGGWYHTSKLEGHDCDDILPTVIQIQAIHSAGRGVPTKEVEHAQAYLQAALKNAGGAKSKRNSDGSVDVVAARAVYALSSVREREGGLTAPQVTVPLGSAIQFGRDDLGNYYHAQTKCRNDASWKSYRESTFDHVASGQNKDGSWPASDGISAGRVYSTALWCTILQLGTGRHPCAYPEKDRK